MGKKLTLQIVIDRCNKKHNNFYDYSEIKEYMGGKTKHPIKCKDHGIFWQELSNHINGHGCNKCACEKRAKIKKTIAKEKFIREVSITHDFYYSYPRTEYNKDKEKVIITCPNPIHGDFLQTPADHKAGKGCIKCGFEKTFFKR